jgi:hypothetical protein
VLEVLLETSPSFAIAPFILDGNDVAAAGTQCRHT